MSKKHKKVCRVLYYIENSLIEISIITGSVSISAFASLAKSKLNYIEVLISKALTDSNISHDEFALMTMF